MTGKSLRKHKRQELKTVIFFGEKGENLALRLPLLTKKRLKKAILVLEKNFCSTESLSKLSKNIVLRHFCAQKSPERPVSPITKQYATKID